MLDLWKTSLDNRSKAKGSTQTIGAEFEHLVLLPNNRPQSISGPEGMSQLLKSLEELKIGKVVEVYKDLVYSLETDFGLITLEPGCQLELSTPPRSGLAEISADLQKFKASLLAIHNLFPIKMIGMGYHPLLGPDSHHLLPKPRYQLMDAHFLGSGSLGSSMMRTSASTQVCIDYFGVEDLENKLIAALKSAPFLRAMFANSPLYQGKPWDHNCYRSLIWANTDPKRSLIPLSMLSSKFSLNAYLDGILNMPAMFFKQGDTLIPDGKSSLMDKFPDLAHQPDWEEKLNLHNSQSFFESRIKHFLEIRTPDAQIPRFQMSPVALIRGLFQNPESLNNLLVLLQEFSLQEIYELLHSIHLKGIHTSFRSYTALDVCKEILKIAESGLNQLEDPKITQSTLGPLLEILLEDSMSPGEFLLRMFEKDCSSNINSLLTQINFLQ